MKRGWPRTEIIVAYLMGWKTAILLPWFARVDFLWEMDQFRCCSEIEKTVLRNHWGILNDAIIFDVNC